MRVQEQEEQLLQVQVQEEQLLQVFHDDSTTKVVMHPLFMKSMIF